MRNRETKYYVAILLIVAAYLISSFIWGDDILTKRVTIVTALVSAVAFWLEFRRTERLNESSFIMNLNNQFISNPSMTFIEHELELYYNQYVVQFNGGEAESLDDVRDIHLGINLSRSSEDCQKLINYLVYLEALAALVDRGVIHLSVIDDLFSYRFFIAVNNPIVQENELYPYKDFYCGVYRLSKLWTADHIKRKIAIPMAFFKLEEQSAKRERRAEWATFLDVSLARATDNKTDIGRVLYDTDPYIYPEAFGSSRDRAARSIGRLIGMDNTLLDYKNIIVARYNGMVAGVCLVTDGNYTWNKEELIKRIEKNLPMIESFEYASDEYFSKLGGGNNCIEIVSLSVDEGFRRKHIGSALLKEVSHLFPDKVLTLEVLEENKAAIKMYESVGFEIVGEHFEGFAPAGLKRPMCVRMQRS